MSVINGQHPIEMRLREKIDFLRDERDEALAELWSARDRIDELERRLNTKRGALSKARRSRDMWRSRWSTLNRRTSHLRRYWRAA